MSGGTYDYFYAKLERISEMISEGEEKKEEPSPLRLAFVKHLELVSKALYAIEWVDSYDWGPDDDVEAIREALGMSAKPLLTFIEAGDVYMVMIGEEHVGHLVQAAGQEKPNWKWSPRTYTSVILSTLQLHEIIWQLDLLNKGVKK